MKKNGLITREELLAAGALYVPPAWRKTLGGEQQLDLFSHLTDDDSPYENEADEEGESDGEDIEDEES